MLQVYYRYEKKEGGSKVIAINHSSEEPIPQKGDLIYFGVSGLLKIVLREFYLNDKYMIITCTRVETENGEII